MVGAALVDIRDHIETLASDDGDYYVVCGRTGDRPVPVSGLRFDGREAASSAADATEQYRSALRRYDPQVPYYDLIVCQRASREPAPTRSRSVATETLRYLLFGSPGTSDDGPERRTLVEFCHRIVGAVFETLSEEGYGDVESGIIDAYFELAETIDHPDELCLSLLESMTAKLDDNLRPTSQREVLTGTAARLEPADRTEDAIAGTFSTLAAHGVIRNYTRSPRSIGFDNDTRSTVARIDGYAFSPHDGRLPVLPLTVELIRHKPTRLPRSVHVSTVDDGLQLTFSMTDTAVGDGLVSASIDRTA